MASLVSFHLDKVADIIEERDRIKKRLYLREIELAKALKSAQKAGVDTEDLARQMHMTRTGVYNYIERHIPKDQAKKLRKGKPIEGARRDIESR